MLRVAQLDVGRPGNGGARIDQVRWVKDAGAVSTLVAAGPLVTAMRAGADDVTIGEKAPVIDRVDLSRRSLFQERILIELVIKVLRDLVVLRRMGPAKVIEGETETVSEIFLQDMHLGAILIDRKAGFVRGQFRRGAVLIGGANKQDFVASRALKAGIGIRRQHGPNQVTEMLYTIDVRQRGG